MVPAMKDREEIGPESGSRINRLLAPFAGIEYVSCAAGRAVLAETYCRAVLHRNSYFR